MTQNKPFKYKTDTYLESRETRSNQDKCGVKQNKNGKR